MAISLGISQATQLEGIKGISVFTDSIALARRAVDPSVHSGQSWSITVCKSLDAWLAADADRTVRFYAVPSKSKWPFHTIVHNHVTKYPRVALGARHTTTLNRVRKDKVEKALEEWRQLFSRTAYRGRHFLSLKNPDSGNTEQPTYFKGGTWLPHCDEPCKFARFVRMVTNHAPIGAYRARFFPGDDFESRFCPCGADFESRHHILTRCPEYDYSRVTHGRAPCTMYELLCFLEDNPRAFSFRTPLPAGGIG
jgi:hypothetical protein